MVEKLQLVSSRECRMVISRFRGKNDWQRLERFEIVFVKVRRIKGKVLFRDKPIHVVGMDRLAIRERGGRLRSIAAKLFGIENSHEFKISTDRGQFSIIADGFVVVPMASHVP